MSEIFRAGTIGLNDNGSAIGTQKITDWHADSANAYQDKNLLHIHSPADWPKAGVLMV